MATLGFRLAEGNPVVKIYPEASAQTFVAGDLVYLVSGKVTIVANDTSIVGIAGKGDVSTDAEIPVYIITPEQTYVCEIDTTSATSQVGVDYGLNISTGSMSVDQGDETTTAVTVVDLVDAAGTTSKPRVLVKFHVEHLDMYAA
ncbi:MAG: hypothetical protein V3V81_08180 [Candidatus Bathyarchaeia archaeon]